MKAFNLPIDYVLHELSYANLTLYIASLPTYRSPKDKKGTYAGSDGFIDGDDPRNFDKVNSFIDSLD